MEIVKVATQLLKSTTKYGILTNLDLTVWQQYKGIYTWQDDIGFTSSVGDVATCLATCDDDHECLSIEYYTDTGNCVRNSKTKETGSVWNDDGYLFFQKTKLSLKKSMIIKASAIIVTYNYIRYIPSLVMLL